MEVPNSNLDQDGSWSKIFKFVLTGGPCSGTKSAVWKDCSLFLTGKTTAMERLPVFLRERGFRVFIAPEAATMMFLNGFFFPNARCFIGCQGLLSTISPSHTAPTRSNNS
jgi:hypothetical protein